VYKTGLVFVLVSTNGGLKTGSGKCLPQDEKSLTKTSISSGVNKYVFSLGQLVLPDLFGNIFHNLRRWGAREYGHP